MSTNAGAHTGERRRSLRIRSRAVAFGLAAGLGAVSMLGAGCGISADGAPREIGQEALPPALQIEPTTTTTTVPQSPGATVQHNIYFARSGPDNELTLAKVALPVQIPSDADAEQQALRLVDALLKVRTEALAAYGPGIQNRVPLNTAVNRTEMLPNGILVIDFNKQLSESVVGEGQFIAIAQIVFTATEIPGINGVIIRIDGVDQAVRVEGSISRDAGVPVYRSDFERLNNAVSAGEASPGSG